MSVLDQAFIKAFSQQNSALEPTAAEAAKKVRQQRSASPATDPAKAAKAVSRLQEEVQTAAAEPSKEIAKAVSKRKGKSVDESASDRVFAAMERKDVAKPAAAKRQAVKKPTSAKVTKKAAASTARGSIGAASGKPAKKLKTNAEETLTPETIYRVDSPVTTGDGDPTGVRTIIPGPHTDVIFSTMDNSLPRRELLPNRNVSPTAETPAAKNAAEKRAELKPENQTAAENQLLPENLGKSQPLQSFCGNWIEDSKPATTHSAHNPINQPASPSPVQESNQTPAQIFESLSASLKQYSLPKVPLPEKSVSPCETPAFMESEKKVAVEKRSFPADKSDSTEQKSLPEKPPVAEAPTGPAIRLFQPMLQVDHFTWPKVCSRLESGASPELEDVVETLIAAQIREKKVFVLGGCHSGDGATSLVLATAKRLAAQGVKVALVDADWSQPQLARRLGLLPQFGWEDVLAGRLPLEEVLIESIAEKLVVLPVREPFGATDLPGDASSRFAESWHSLRHHFDFVLVDPGPLPISPILDPQFASVMAGRIDAAILVKNIRQTNSREFDAALMGLQNVGAKVIGVVENFVG